MAMIKRMISLTPAIDLALKRRAEKLGLPVNTTIRLLLLRSLTKGMKP